MLRALLLAAGLLLAGCVAPQRSDEETPPTTPTTPTAQTDRCVDFTVEAVPASAGAGQPRTLVANLTNCGEETLRLSHACVRGMDLRIIVLYNSTDPERELPPGVGPKVSYLVDNPIANAPLLCATAPPHVREVPAGETKTYAVTWSGLVSTTGSADAAAVQPLPPGRYLLAANAEDADTYEAYIATSELRVT